MDVEDIEMGPGAKGVLDNLAEKTFFSESFTMVEGNTLGEGENDLCPHPRRRSSATAKLWVCLRLKIVGVIKI